MGESHLEMAILDDDVHFSSFKNQVAVLLFFCGGFQPVSLKEHIIYICIYINYIYIYIIYIIFQQHLHR